ncbi:MAG: metalloregulator ArsR/SmtB family transcription factor [Verrucomicrobiota bacterium]|jgi:ArsR family transcriptional regulator|nr:metalloregulator ArsR/SmtB family transcription factor [Verrucomicrobiota bacterium]
MNQISPTCNRPMQEEADLLKGLSDPIRLRLVVLLANNGEVCVCHLVTALDEPQYKISRHLGVLRAAGWVHARRDGAWMHYRLAEGDNLLQRTLQNCLRDSFRHHPEALRDQARLNTTCCEAP